MDNLRICQCCGKEVERESMMLTYDCHGIPFRYVCTECYEKIYSRKDYDGAYYTEADECIDDDY